MASNIQLNAEILKCWDKSGKDQFMKLFTPFLKDDEKTPLFLKTGKLSGCSQLLYELLLSGIRGHLRRETVVSALHELCLLHPDIPSVILDVVCILDAETCSDLQDEARSNFCYIVRESERFISDKLLKERLEIDTLQDVGTLKNKNFYTKFIKIKTKLYYKQRKFNLFREESEGYAKLVVELNQEITDVYEWKVILEVIKSLIGCFNLDPNRVLDIILESFEARPHQHDFFIPLIKNYMGDANVICEVIGFKLSTVDPDESTQPSPLLIVIALMLQHGVIDLDDIYPWLRPDDNILINACEKEAKSAHEYIKRLNIISTKTPPTGGAADTAEEKDDPQDKYSNNQKLTLGTALLDIGCWTVFSTLAARLPEGTALAPRPPALALCRMIHALVEPVYRKHCSVAPNIVGKPIPPLPWKLAPLPAETFEELKETVIPALIALGPSLHYDPVLMYKAIRILRNSRSLPEDPLHYEALSILDSSLLPALAHLDGNCCMAEEIYTLIKLYPYQCRYCLYSRWKNDAPERHPALMRRRGVALQRIKAIMKRVSKENIKPQGRLIGKLSHSAPGFLFDYMLLQIQIYDNLIAPVVESLKYLTSLSYDVLGFCLLEALTGSLRDPAAAIAVGVGAHPQWLQGLAQFCGAAFKKYSIELTGLLQYVANQLKAQKSQDLLILKEIVTKMAGIEAAEEMTPDQLDAMAGGELLKGEAGYFAQVRNTRRSSARLKEAVAGTNLDISLCLLAAQQRHCCVWKGVEETNPSGGSHLKLVGRLVDQCQDALVQLGSFLATAHTPEEYAARLPSIEEMLRDYHVGADVAFFLFRPVLAQRIAARAEVLKKAGSSSNIRWSDAAKDALEPVVLSVTPQLPSRVWEDISPEFYVTFWSLTMYDLKVPVESYQNEINKLKQAAVNASKETRDQPSQGNKGKKEQERYHTLIEKLQEEKRKQEDHVARVHERLKRESATWFPARAVKSAKNETVTRLMQLCLFPRCIFTATDALYCAEFVHTVHALKTANFSTLLCYDRLFCDITYSVTSCTEGEAARYGRFLRTVLATAMRWHADRSAFQRECADYPGFVTKYRVSNQFSEANDHVGYENYRHVCHKWHYKITKAMVVCLDSGDYVQIRNALIVLIRVLPHFPVLAKLSQIIERKIDKVREEEKGHRQDLFVLATSYSGQLRARASSMMREADFHQMSDKQAASNGQSILMTHSSQETVENNTNGVRSQSDNERKEQRTADRHTAKSGSDAPHSDREKESKRDVQNKVERERTKDEPRRKDRSPRDRNYREDRYLETVSPVPALRDSSDSQANNSAHRHTLEESDRDVKRRKIESCGSSKQTSKDSDEKSPDKEKRKSSKLRDDRKERKMNRKRDRGEDTAVMEQKRRRDEQKALKMAVLQNGSQDDHHFEKFHHKREKSPPYRDRTHEHPESRDKHRRSADGKLRR